MKKVLFIILAALFSIPAAAQKDAVEYLESSARNMEPTQSVVILPLAAEMKVMSDRITYTETESFKHFPVTPSIVSNIPNFKKIALSKAMHKYDADALVGATFDIITNASGLLEITVTGYPVKYINFRNATQEDIDLVKSASTLDNKNDETISNPESQTRVTLTK